ncbi:hypothetical protein [Streptomyces sp. NPDC047108]|uniref:hypothetical protein n=1 Tax=Streptomyces sp. NPDC047108 TaxID=3155025 RepID=UPI0033E39662
MPGLNLRRPLGMGTAASVTVVVLAAGPAWAGYGDGGATNGGTHTSGDAGEDGTVSATAGGIVYDHSKNGSGNNAGAPAPVGNWSPPACWYAPKYTPKQFKKYKEKIWEVDSTSPQWDFEERRRYVNGGPYKNFNLAKSGKGYWWDSYSASNYPPGWDKCSKPPFWVDKGDPPPADTPEAVTPEILAQLAYAEIRLPDTRLELNPEGGTKVNLPTWAWLDNAAFRPVSVTASVPALNIQATTTAEPVSLRIEPGTDDAQTYPASGECRIEDGRIGQPYTKGHAKTDPPCGVKYLRSSGDGTYPLKATITWKIHWTGTGTGGGGLPDGHFGTTQDITVGEIQAINR